MTVLPENIDLTSNRDFGDHDRVTRYLKHDLLGSSIKSGRLQHTMHYLDPETRELKFTNVWIFPWDTYKAPYNNRIQDCSRRKTEIEHEIGIRFDGNINDPFVFGSAKHMENDLNMLRTYRAEELMHYCYRCGVPLNILNYNYGCCLCDECMEDYHQEQQYRKLDMERPDYEGFGIDSFDPT